MNVGTLRELLEGHDDNEPVMIAYQPSWPLAAELDAVTSLRDLNLSEDDLAEQHHSLEEELDAVWLVAGESPRPDPYAPSAVFGGSIW